MLTITPTMESEITKIVCPHCNTKVPRMPMYVFGLNEKDSIVKGLTFKCRTCGKLYEVKTE